MRRALIGFLVMLGLVGLVGAVATGQTIPPPVHLPLVRLDETPTATATVSPTPTVVVVPTPTQGPDGPCLCDRNRYNCSDFTTQAEAQACFDFCVAQGAGDVHRLDRDNDGVACEALPFGWGLLEEGSGGVGGPARGRSIHAWGRGVGRVSSLDNCLTRPTSRPY